MIARTEPTETVAYRGLTVNAERTVSSLEQSCQWGNTKEGGMDRLTANDDDKKVRHWFIEETKKYGCFHKIDEMGNIFAIRPGQNNDLPPIAMGSHLDTQPTGGKYDGILGVICGMEVLRVVHENNITTYAPLAVVDWTNEEGARFPPAMLCSGVWAGEFTVEYGHTRSDNTGRTLKQELERIDFLGAEPCSYRTNPLLAHFEIHIEQGPVLDAAEQPVAVVRGVQSMRWYTIHLTGAEAHTGTTPMNRRRDALLGAAQMIVETNRLAMTAESTEKQNRMTIGVINSGPQSINTIAGHVQMNLDIRSPSNDDVEDMEKVCIKNFTKIAEDLGLEFTLENIWTSPAVLFDETMVKCIRASALDIGCSIELTSGAGHDSVYTSKQCPSAMLFARCKDGVSHNPAEYTSPEDCVSGAQVLLGAYLRYDDHIRRTHGPSTA